MLLPFKSLLVFEAVTRNCSFTKAAEELNVTQSAISHQVKNLEEFFSIKLLDRSGPVIALTEEGQILYQDLSEAMSLVRRGVGRVKAKTAISPIGISVRPHFAMKWLSPRLSGTQFGFDFRFYHSNSAADFSDSDIHLSIEWLHVSQVPSNAHLLVEGRLTPACHPDLLEGLEDTQSPALLERFALLHETDATSWREWLTMVGHSELQPLRNEYYSDTNVRQQAAIEKLGFALVCPELVAEDIRKGRLVCPFRHNLPSYSYYLIVPDDRMNISKVRTFVSWLKEQV
ncbi:MULTISPECIES: LysR family transcriptional regulator [Neptunomonas]|uniref:LysR family transcriptional regulator n=1 Tax=Neptunomonas marina TaxID=1815562 RepID=A0A437QCG3_9GAMM|nr:MULTISPECIES: LysR family transcriptional regulator [Neptunomonas]RVU32206.1 LysR family transcriptional regulator [Neptunomonas marina]